MTQSLERQMLLPAGGIQPLAEIASKKSQKVEAVKDIVYGSVCLRSLSQATPIDDHRLLV
jgi:hypothetical protein